MDIQIQVDGSTNLRGLQNCKDKSQETHTETHYNEAVKRQRQRRNLEGSKRKGIHHLQDIPAEIL